MVEIKVMYNLNHYLLKMLYALFTENACRFILSADQHDQPKYIMLIWKTEKDHGKLFIVREKLINGWPLFVLIRHLSFQAK
jgi:hypothetical protein